MLQKFQNNKVHQVYGVAILLFIVKLCLLPLAQTVHSDAVCRVFLSVDWANDPHWIIDSIWAPFHFYLNGICLLLWNDPIYSPKLLNISLSCFTLIPFFYFVRREFNENGAFVATIFLAISPILFRNSLQALAGTPYLFFFALALNWISKAMRETKHGFALIAGLAITIAAGIRYEGWLIIPLIWLVIIRRRKWTQSFIYGFSAIIFPIFWLITCWMVNGDPLWGIKGNYHWTMDIMDNNLSLGWESYLRRTWFWPFSFIIALGAPAAFITVKMIFSSYKSHKDAAVWSIPFWIFFVCMIYNTLQGTLVIQHRFIGTLVMLSLPFLALYFTQTTRRKTIQAWVFGFLTIGLSLIYNTHGVKPIPRLSDQSTVVNAQIIQDNVTPESGLILDFASWAGTYYIALHAGLQPHNIVLPAGATNSTVPIGRIRIVLTEFSSGLIWLKDNSAMFEVLGNEGDLSRIVKGESEFNIQEIHRADNFALLEWNKK